MVTNVFIPLAILIIIVTPVIWIVSEFKAKKRWVRITLGSLAILCLWGVAFVAAQIVRLNYNIWYSDATKKLISVSVEKLEQGQVDSVIKHWSQLRDQIQPTYEKKGNYNELVSQAVEKINSLNTSRQAIKKGNNHIEFWTKYKFDDYVEFKSQVNGTGRGKILVVTIDKDGFYDYQILLENSNDIQGGICDDDIKLIKPAKQTQPPYKQKGSK